MLKTRNQAVIGFNELDHGLGGIFLQTYQQKTRPEARRQEAASKPPNRLQIRVIR
jgi:hypothetical protein